ncbi:MAG: F0F1 ATP synthase subunit B [Tissierellia bacterium]|nr:F0F1 ATP synthase subunit B [Tissierellia bacterium]
MFNIFVDIEPANLILQIIVTVVLYFSLRHFLFKPVSELLQKRKNYVESNILDSENAKAEALMLKEQYQLQLIEAKNEASQIVSDARSYGEEVKNKAIKESKDLARLEYEKGIKDLENQKQKVLSSLNDEIVDMAIIAAEKVLRDNVNEKTDKKMIRNLAKDLEESYE